MSLSSELIKTLKAFVLTVMMLVFLFLACRCSLRAVFRVLCFIRMIRVHWVLYLHLCKLQIKCLLCKSRVISQVCYCCRFYFLKWREQREIAVSLAVRAVCLPEQITLIWAEPCGRDAVCKQWYSAGLICVVVHYMCGAREHAEVRFSLGSVYLKYYMRLHDITYYWVAYVYSAADCYTAITVPEVLSSDRWNTTSACISCIDGWVPMHWSN